MSKRLIPFVMLVGITLLVAGPTDVNAQLGETTSFLAHISNLYRVIPNVTYHIASNQENKLDLYVPRGATGPTPLLIYIHGGGWVGGAV